MKYLLLSLLLSLLTLAGCSGSPRSPYATPPSATPAASPAEPSPPAPEQGTFTGTVAAQPAASKLPPLPKELLIPAIHVDAPVEQVGTTPDGVMDVPKQWNDVGWFDQGYLPGQQGHAVIAGHLDSTTDKAVFWELNKLKPGDQVIVDENDGSQLTFDVTGSDVYPYNQAPLQQIFGPADTPMLNLITCNGTFDQGSKNYDKRLVVHTKLATT
ncbi:MAG TPA: class F sortase [Chloroflexota bacterium]|nr:class F sortase [Chloroflexota bacterium]